MGLMFGRGELNDMRSTQELHMMDSCLIAEPTTSTDSYNLPSKSWNWDNAEQSMCGFNANPSKELLDQVPESQAVCRLPIETVLNHRSRIRITHRFGEAIDAITFDVIGTPRQGPSGLLAWLKKVTDGSDG